MRSLSAKDRRRAMGRAFEVNLHHRDKFSGTYVILVDDVLTNGADADGCIKTLRKVGTDWVQIFCRYRVLGGDALVESRAPIAIDA